MLDVQLGNNRAIRIIGVYMPHSMLPDENVDCVYSLLDTEIADARAKKYSMILTGDFNAEIGRR